VVLILSDISISFAIQSIIQEAEVVFQRRLETSLTKKDFDDAQQLESELTALKDLAVRHVSGKSGDDNKSGKSSKDGGKGGSGAGEASTPSSSKPPTSRSGSHKAHLSPTWNKVLATAAGYLVKRFELSDGKTTV